MIFERLADFDSLCCFRKEDVLAISGFLRRLTMDCAPGRHEIDGSRIYVNISNYTTRPVAESLYEAHRRYADIQLLLIGSETVEYMPLDRLEECKPYDESGDAALYRCQEEAAAELHLTPESFAVFFPNDGHRPCLTPFGENPRKVLKVVVKVALD